MQPFLEWTRQGKYQWDVLGEPFWTDHEGRPHAQPWIQRLADAYNVKHELPSINHAVYVQVHPHVAEAIADAYEALPFDDSENPLVKEAYEALAREVHQQYYCAVEQGGMTFEPWKDAGDAYENVFQVALDVEQHRHMYFYTGGSPNRYMAVIDPTTGYPVNDLLRAIHDFYGHLAIGADFGPQGEENAWVQHSQMFTLLARYALTTETRGQNNYLNWGRQNYDAKGRYLNIRPQDRPYALQKCAVFSGKDSWIVELPKGV